MLSQSPHYRDSSNQPLIFPYVDAAYGEVGNTSLTGNSMSDWGYYFDDTQSKQADAEDASSSNQTVDPANPSQPVDPAVKVKPAKLGSATGGVKRPVAEPIAPSKPPLAKKPIRSQSDSSLGI